MAGLSPEQSVDDATLVTHFLTGSLLQGKTARFDNAMQAYQKHNLWVDKNACLEQGFRALEEHIETICLNVPTTPAALSSPESKMTEKPPVTQRNVPLSSAASPQPDDVDGMPYRTSDQASAPVINNYYITNNYACPHCINKVSDTSNHYANATATVTIDGVTTLPTAQSQTVTPKVQHRRQMRRQATELNCMFSSTMKEKQLKEVARYHRIMWFRLTITRLLSSR